MPLIRRATSSPDPAAQAPLPTLAVLLGDLVHTDPENRRRAARGLADYPQAAAPLALAASLEAHGPAREAMFTALMRLGSKAAAAGLVPLLQSEDAGLRNAAIAALKTMPDATADCMGELLCGATDVRIFGVEILGALAHPDSPRWLIRIIEEDTEINVCAAAVDALVECGNHAAIPALLRLLQRFPHEPFLEFSVQTALTRIASA